MTLADSPNKIDTLTHEIDLTRNAVIARIKAALQRRSGKPWSVTGGQGTAYGWITIAAPPKRRTAHCQLKPDAITDWAEDYEDIDTGQPGGHMTPGDRAALAELLGYCDLNSIPYQGVSVMSSLDAYREYIDRAEGRAPAKIAEP